MQMPYLRGSVYKSDIKSLLRVTWDGDDPVPQLKEVSVPNMSTYRELPKI